MAEGSDQVILEDELWRRSLVMAEIIERQNEVRDSSRNESGADGGDLVQDLDSAVDAMELQRSLMLSELSTTVASDPARTAPSDGGMATAAANSRDGQLPSDESRYVHSSHNRDEDAEAVANLMAQIVSATEDGTRRQGNPADSGWIHGVRGAFDRLMSDIRSSGSPAAQRRAAPAPPPSPEIRSRSWVSEAGQLLAAAFPDRLRQRNADGGAAFLASIVATRGQDDDAGGDGLWLSESSGGATLPHSQRSARSPNSSRRVRSAIQTYERALAGILRRPGQGAPRYAGTVSLSRNGIPDESSTENIRDSWRRRNTGSHVDLMAEILANDGRNREDSERAAAIVEDEAETLRERRRNLFFAEIEPAETVAQVMRRMGEAAHALLSDELDISLTVAVEPASARATQDSVCVVCLESPRSHAFIPCGHRCVCQGCVRRMRTRLSSSAYRCPICRRHATDIIKIYL